MDKQHAGVMIDHPGTHDRDDAIWVERDGDGWRVWVHVADVASVVRLGSADDIEASRRVETRYLPDTIIGMLPRQLQDEATLREDAELATCLIEFTVSPAGELAIAGIGQGKLTDAYAVSFHDTTQILADSSHQLNDVLGNAHNLARVLLARRQSAGALAIYDLLHGWATTEEGTIVELAESERNAGYVIVQELMIAANDVAASWAVQHEVPLLFRNHNEGSADRDDLATWLEAAEDETRLLTARQQLSSALRPAVYEATATGHFGLSLSAYTHVTSPLRRYPDLVNQRILLAVAAGKTSPYSTDTLDETAAAVNLRHEAIRVKKARRYRDAAGRETRSELVSESYRELDDSAFGKVVRMAVRENRFSSALADEVERRLAADQLLPREAAWILLETDDDQWKPIRERLIRWLADSPEHALTVLSMHAQQSQIRLRWDEQSLGAVTQPVFEAAARFGDRTSQNRRAPSKKAARQQAAVALIAELTGLADLSRDLEPEVTVPEKPARAIPEGHPPVSVVNEFAQAGVLVDLTWEFASAGSAHEPLHTCTVSAIVAEKSEEFQATASGATKSAAKAAAAAEFLAQLPDP